MASHAQIAYFAVAILLLNCSTAQQNVQRCVAFLRQLPSFNSCNCNEDMKTCSCLVDSQRKTSDACRLAFALSNSNVSSSLNIAKRQREPFPPPNGIDLRPRNTMLGTLTGLEEPIFHLRRLPNDLRELNTRFILYNDRVPEIGLELDYNDVGSTVRVFSRRRFHRLFVIAHDFNEGQIESSPNYVELKNRLLSFVRPFRSAVLFVDWQFGAQGNVLGLSFHNQAAANTIVVGREVALICYHLVNEQAAKEMDVHLIGNGLGAQMLHFSAKYYTRLWRDFVPNGDNPAGRDGPQHKLGRFTALDPIAKDFQGYLSNNLVVSHVNRWDASFVDVIHTSSVKFNSNFLDSFLGQFGMSIPCGKIDFYPNGGIAQPNCNSFFNLRTRESFFSNCHHEMALHYFIGSITRNVNISNAFTAFSTLTWFDDQMFFEKWRDRPVNFMGINARDSRDIKRSYSMPIYLDIANYSINGPETKKISYNGKDIEISVDRILHPNFVQPNVTSGQIIRDFPQQKPTQLTALDPLERYSCGQFRTPPAVGGTEGRVVQGHFSFANQFPWTFCLLSYSIALVLSEWEQTCSGVILDRNWLLTAAHCLRRRIVAAPLSDDEQYEFYPDGWIFYVTFGTTDCLLTEGTNYRRFVLIPGSTVFFPPNWNPNDRYAHWDAALMRLEMPIDLPEPYDGGLVNSVCWRTAPKFDFSNRETDLYIAGYGSKNYLEQFSNQKLTWMAYRTVQPDFTTFLKGKFVKEQLEAGPGLFVTLRPKIRDLLQSVCPGDSGGGYWWYIRAQNAPASTVDGVSPFRGVVVAIESQGPSCDNPEVSEDGGFSSPELVTGLRNEVFDWMLQIISANDQAGSANSAANEDPVTKGWKRPPFEIV